MTTLTMFKNFLANPDAWDMYITGRAGTGKTTETAALVKHLEANNISYLVCAYTHKACEVLEEKLPVGANIATLHSFLRKRPTINTHALKQQHIESSKQMSTPDNVDVLLVDEYSIVGEKDYMDVVAMQDSDYDAECSMKVVYIGDAYQLPPVGDMQTIQPHGKYAVTLDVVHRTGALDLLDAMTKLVYYIDNPSKAKALAASEHLIRGVDLFDRVTTIKHASKCVLAYTNKAVEEANRLIEGRDYPVEGSQLFSPSLRTFYVYYDEVAVNDVVRIITHTGELGLATKYNTLEHLLTMEHIKFYSLHDVAVGQDITMACVFGHYQHKLMLKSLQQAATDANAAIENKYAINAATWSKANPRKLLARTRAKAWRDYLTFKDCVMCIDFTHAMTVHKSQGSTFDHVFIDTNDLYICAQKDFRLYLRLLYVAISRAAKCVYTN